MLPESIKKKLLALVGKPKIERMLGLCSILTECLAPHKVTPVIVGGFAVELYTLSSYSTEDVDLVLSRRDLANDVLLACGFVRKGKDWISKELQLVIEIPDDMLAGDVDRIMKLNLEDGSYVNVIGIEDLIIDRLCAGVHWKTKNDFEWARRLFLTHKDEIDIEYLKEVASKEGVVVFVNVWLDELGY